MRVGRRAHAGHEGRSARELTLQRASRVGGNGGSNTVVKLKTRNPETQEMNKPKRQTEVALQTPRAAASELTLSHIITLLSEGPEVQSPAYLSAACRAVSVVS